MKRLLISLLFLGGIVHVGAQDLVDRLETEAPDSMLLAMQPIQPSSLNQIDHKRYLDCRLHHGRKGWARLIPTHLKTQYAGAMGFLSLGAGWDYGRKCRWETDLFVGFIPRSKADNFYITTTLKQNYIPWAISLGRRCVVEPFYTGVYVNTIYGKKFWKSAPIPYPDDYYEFSTKFHLFLFTGQRFSLKTNIHRQGFIKSITFFYELSISDIDLLYTTANRCIDYWDAVGLSFGIKLQIF